MTIITMARHETVLEPYDISQFHSITTGIQLTTAIYNVMNMYLRCPLRCQPIWMAYPLHSKQSQVLAIQLCTFRRKYAKHPSHTIVLVATALHTIATFSILSTSSLISCNNVQLTLVGFCNQWKIKVNAIVKQLSLPLIVKCLLIIVKCLSRKIQLGFDMG